MVGEKVGLEPTKQVADGKLQRFAIAGADKHWHWADATIDGGDVVVKSAEVAEPVAVRYAFSMNPLGANLYNKEGIPASPFRTDDW
jgi:sialate O-acetylesterase